jgi:excisionase family DNA binding protein
LLPEAGRHAGSELYLTVREVARRLRVSTATVYKLCARGELVHVRVLNVLRIPATALYAMATRGQP